MADKPEIHEEMLERAMAYYGGNLSPEEAAEFEAHLAGCEGCREALREANATFPAVEQVLRFKPKRTIDEQVARFEAMLKARDEKQRSISLARVARPRGVRLWVGLAFAVAVAVATVFAFSRLSHIIVRPGDQVYGPQPPAGDGG
jgi:anti-sigma factor RsiW